MTTSGDERWWPRARSRNYVPMRAGALIYAVLGPRSTVDILQALYEIPIQDRPESIDRLLSQLEDCVGRSPWMLRGLAAGAGAAARLFTAGIDRSDPDRSVAFLGVLGEVEKHLGGLVMEAWEQFGFDEERFRRWFDESSGLFDHDNWPPRGVAYSRFEVPKAGVQSAEAAFPDERFAILDSLDRRYGIADGLVRSDTRLARDDARTFARLTAATAQWWRWRLIGSEQRPTSPYDDDSFTIHLCESITWFSSASWAELTDARMICFVADLAETLRMILVFGLSDAMRRLQDVLLLVCDGNESLLDIAEQAGAALQFPESAALFTEKFAEIRRIG